MYSVEVSLCTVLAKRRQCRCVFVCIYCMSVRVHVSLSMGLCISVTMKKSGSTAKNVNKVKLILNQNEKLIR